MYEGEPIIDVVTVIASWASRLGILEMPKSSTLMTGLPLGRSARNRFAGLRSRWTMPSACASAIASIASRR